MGRDGRINADYVTGPDGRSLTRDTLPPPDTKRWVSRRKAEVVAAVQGGLISLEDACERYRLSIEEYLTWENAIHRYGLNGLRAADMQQHRHH